MEEKSRDGTDAKRAKRIYLPPAGAPKPGALRRIDILDSDPRTRARGKHWPAELDESATMSRIAGQAANARQTIV